MAHSYALGQARTSSAGNPITVSFAVVPGVTVLGVLLKVTGATDRAGGVLTWGEYTLVQASTTQKAAASPEAGAELWYLLNPPAQTKTLTIPNTGALTILYTIVTASAKAGSVSALDGVNGGNGTSTNPTPGAIVTTEDGDILFGVVASGATTWAPSAQAGTAIANTDDGAHGGGEQYLIQGAKGSATLNWTFGTSDDWGAVVAAFKEVGTRAFENYHADRLRADGNMCVAK
jgi:hypothetical protein